jgi:hypothetical protein
MKQFNEIKRMQQLAGILREGENKGWPKDREKWNKMTKDQQNAVIDRMNKDMIAGRLEKKDKWIDYDSLHSDFYEELHNYL